MSYDPAAIEPKWQSYWAQKETFKTSAPKAGQEKCYVLDMFPYPSGAGLHVGHPLGYTATDIYSRYKRMRGACVLHPMGFDAFGLPAEQHAVATGEHPALITAKNCDIFTAQMQRIGLSYDWDRRIETCTPDYYHWTQWIFLKIFNSWFDPTQNKARPISELPIPNSVKAAGDLAINQYQAQYRLAYYADAMVNWCPALGTVLANEEVIDGKSERGGHEVVRKPMKQWMLRITAYAERLISELDEIEWPEAIKEQQRNWIGRRNGAEIEFKVVGSEIVLTAFTTRADTLFGVTFFVVSPEHPLVEKITDPSYRESVGRYCDEAKRLSEFARTVENRKKTGVPTGCYVTNPISGEAVPIYIGDYVLMSYGTGCVMGVPAHDERDFEFARTFQIEIRPVIRPENATPAELQAVLEGEVAWTEAGVMLPCDSKVAKDLQIVGASNSEVAGRIAKWLEQHHSGRIVVNYKLRDWLFSRQRYWGEPIPIVHWEDGRVCAINESELPLLLPEVEDYKPSDGGESPLAKAKGWLEVEDSKKGQRGRRETNTMPQWAGSCWYYLRFIDPKNREEAWDRKLESAFMPVDMYVGGAEHAVLHLLYSRFWHKVLFDLGYVSTREPFKKLFNQGMILAFAYKNKRGALIASDLVNERDDGSIVHKENGEVLERIVAKMSKSLRNVVNPEDIINQYGADTLRLYLMFRGPLDSSGVWDPKAIAGVHRFLRRSHTLVEQYCAYPSSSDKPAKFVSAETESKTVKRALHHAIKKVAEDIESFQFNTTISTLMESLNTFAQEPLSRETIETYVLLLAPLAPHLAEELWQMLGKSQTLAYEQWPSFNPEFLKQDLATVVVQVVGKKRALIEVPLDVSEQDLKSAVTSVLHGTPYQTQAGDRFITVYQSGTKTPKLVNVIPLEGRAPPRPE